MSCNVCLLRVTNTYVVMESLKMHIGCYEKMSKCLMCERKCFDDEKNSCLICGLFEINDSTTKIIKNDSTENKLNTVETTSDEKLSARKCNKCTKCNNYLIEKKEWNQDLWGYNYQVNKYYCKYCTVYKYQHAYDYYDNQK